jgi:hypothetical protein
MIVHHYHDHHHYHHHHHLHPHAPPPPQHSEGPNPLQRLVEEYGLKDEEVSVGEAGGAGGPKRSAVKMNRFDSDASESPDVFDEVGQQPRIVIILVFPVRSLIIIVITLVSTSTIVLVLDVNCIVIVINIRLTTLVVKIIIIIPHLHHPILCLLKQEEGRAPDAPPSELNNTSGSFRHGRGHDEFKRSVSHLGR